MTIRHSGAVALIGRPNVGKSTLLNAILGEKIAIVSPKPQTTRSRITGIYTRADTQIIFLDTPGWHASKTKLGGYMDKAVDDALADEVDAVLFVIEPKMEPRPEESVLLKKLPVKTPVILVINKVDNLAEKSRLMPMIAHWSEMHPFAAVVPLSAKKSDGVGILLDELVKRMPEGPQYYPEDMITAEPERLVVAEIVREKLLTALDAEVPHGVAVSVEKMQKRESGDLEDIDATIFCEKEGHTAIIIGRKGAMLKKIGTEARLDIERLLGCHVNLHLWVKVKENWRNRENILRTLGYGE